MPCKTFEGEKLKEIQEDGLLLLLSEGAGRIIYAKSIFRALQAVAQNHVKVWVTR